MKPARLGYRTTTHIQSHSNTKKANSIGDAPGCRPAAVPLQRRRAPTLPPAQLLEGSEPWGCRGSRSGLRIASNTRIWSNPLPAKQVFHHRAVKDNRRYYCPATGEILKPVVIEKHVVIEHTVNRTRSRRTLSWPRSQSRMERCWPRQTRASEDF
jgi:hypothetical protein